MPQLVPFYFTNQVLFGFGLLVLLIYVFSKYVLPTFVKSFSARESVSKI